MTIFFSLQLRKSSEGTPCRGPSIGLLVCLDSWSSTQPSSYQWQDVVLREPEDGCRTSSASWLLQRRDGDLEEPSWLA